MEVKANIVLLPLLTVCPDKLKIVQTFQHFFPLSKLSTFTGSRNSVVGIATRLGAGRREFESQHAREIFFCPQRPDRLTGPPSLLFNGYRVYFLKREFGCSRVPIAIEPYGAACLRGVARDRDLYICSTVTDSVRAVVRRQSNNVWQLFCDRFLKRHLLTVYRSFMNVANSVLWRMVIILKANKVNLFVPSVLFVFWYHSPNVLDTLYICNISWLGVNAFVYLPQHVSASHCHHQGVVVSSEATQAVCIVAVYGLRPVQSGQLSMDVTKRVQLVRFLRWL
jgi:hypothetical protein